MPKIANSELAYAFPIGFTSKRREFVKTVSQSYRKQQKVKIPIAYAFGIFGAGGSYPVKLPKGSYFLDKLKKRITAIGQKYTAFFINTLCFLSLSSLGFLDFWENFLLARSDKAKRNPENTTTLDSLWETKTNLQINIIIMRPMLFTSLGIGLIILGGNV